MSSNLITFIFFYFAIITSIVGYGFLIVNAANLKVIIHQRRCNQSNACTTNIIDSKIKNELISSIVKKAAVFEKQAEEKK